MLSMGIQLICCASVGCSAGLCIYTFYMSSAATAQILLDNWWCKRQHKHPILFFFFSFLSEYFKITMNLSLKNIIVKTGMFSLATQCYSKASDFTSKTLNPWTITEVGWGEKRFKWILITINNSNLYDFSNQTNLKNESACFKTKFVYNITLSCHVIVSAGNSSGFMWASCYLPSVSFPDIVRFFWIPIQISANKDKCAAKIDSQLLSHNMRRKKRFTYTAKTQQRNVFLVDSAVDLCVWGLCNILTANTFLYLFLSFPACRWTVPRQWASALLQGLQSGDTRQTGRPCIQAEPIGLASVSCLAFKTPPLSPVSWEKWRTWQAPSLGSHWASFQSPWVSAGVRRQWGAPG